MVINNILGEGITGVTVELSLMDVQLLLNAKDSIDANIGPLEESLRGKFLGNGQRASVDNTLIMLRQLKHLLGVITNGHKPWTEQHVALFGTPEQWKGQDNG